MISRRYCFINHSLENKFGEHLAGFLRSCFSFLRQYMNHHPYFAGKENLFSFLKNRSSTLPEF